MPARAARLRNCALRMSSTSALGAPSRLASGCSLPPWRTQAPGAACLHRGQKCVAHLRKQLHVLVAVDEIRRAAEQLLESRELHHQLVLDHLGIEPPQQARCAACSGNGRNMPPSTGRKCMRQRTERRGQSRVQADRAARARRRSGLQRGDLVAADRRADHHHRRRIETAARDQIANGAVDALG